MFHIYFTSFWKLCHLQTAAFSRTANSTRSTDIVCWIKKIHHTDISMPGEKMVGGSPTFISDVTENTARRVQLKERRFQLSTFCWDPGFDQYVSCRKAWCAFANVKVSAEQKVKQKHIRKQMPMPRFFCGCWDGINPYEQIVCFIAVVQWAVRSGGVQRLAVCYHCTAEVPPSPSHLAPNKTTLSCSVPLLGSNSRRWIKALLQGPSFSIRMLSFL